MRATWFDDDEDSASSLSGSDSGECAPEKATSLFVHKLASPLSTAFQARHNISEEGEKMAGVILGVGMRGMLIADGTKRPVGIRPKVPKQGSMLA